MGNFKKYYEEDWSGDGQSAKCIYGVHTRKAWGNKHPYDPDDLTRCFQCLRMITGNELLPDWKKIIGEVCKTYPESKEWKWIFDNFERLFNSYFEEYDTFSMPKTYKLMQEA